MNDSLEHKWAIFLLEASKVFFSSNAQIKVILLRLTWDTEEFLMILLAYNIPRGKYHDLFMFITPALLGVNVELN